MQTPAGMGGVMGGSGAIEEIWAFAETAVDLVDAVYAYRKRPVAEIIQMVAEDRAYNLPAERAYTALAAAKGGGISSMTDEDLGSIFVAAGGNPEHDEERSEDPYFEEDADEGMWATLAPEYLATTDEARVRRRAIRYSLNDRLERTMVDPEDVVVEDR